MVITGDGNVGIGKGPKAPLSISGDGRKESMVRCTSLPTVFFGGNNSGKQIFITSQQDYTSHSLCIVGMSSGTSHTDRKIKMWAEGGNNRRQRRHWDE